MGNRDGAYTVKSGNHFAKVNDVRLLIKNPGSSLQVQKQTWKQVWKLIVPLKIQHFIWRLLHDAVATKDVLFRRKCADNSVCLICGYENETLEHMLFLCP